MDAAEIEVYATKLAEVELALSADPENTELQTLKKEIEDLLLLTSELNEQPPTSAAAAAADSKQAHQQETHNAFDETTKATSLPTKDWRIGDQCEAKYAADGNFYAARVVAVRGGNVFQVAFVGYGDMQETKAQDMRATETQGTTRVQAAETSKNKSDGSKVQQGGRVDKNKAAKNKKNGSSTKAAAAAAQQAWLAFAKGNGSSSSGGKKLKAKAINDKSIFKSPDTVSGKVGVARHTKKK